ncbi:hypothetical protein LH464_15240 [Neorhizobium sp. T786]|uniref:hypothetical protein n=1 Tax=Pseudorhizobium xiangyangii TaxID=2883104 RepID=UPI001CFFD733|nr:hypothetical protein [Neorhizobium xiangyangii]MCB5203826.1 hypothetical protein [Neorhizobium xiangyangii]
MSNAIQSNAANQNNSGVTENRFGQSVESQAQIADAQKIASGSTPGEILNVYRLVPVAPSTDFRWDQAPSMGEIVVAARTAGDARIVAAGRELDFQEIDALPAEDVTTRHASAFRDEKAYTVIEIERGRQDLQRGVLNGEVPVDTITPTQV